MDWQAEYPTVATVNAASFETLQAWDDKLPAAQTDVERAAEQVREKAPDVADKWNDLMGRIETLTGMRDARRM